MFLQMFWIGMATAEKEGMDGRAFVQLRIFPNVCFNKAWFLFLPIKMQDEKKNSFSLKAPQYIGKSLNFHPFA